jgi:outer membrane lipoprotein-sorting protein
VKPCDSEWGAPARTALAGGGQRSSERPTIGGRTRPPVDEARGSSVGKAWTWIALVLSWLALTGCLSHRLTPDQVVVSAQKALSGKADCHAVLEMGIDTDLLKDTVSAEVWERAPNGLKVAVRSSTSPQLRGLEYVTDGTQSQLYDPQANQVLVGAADLVRMPSVIEQLVAARQQWIQEADPQSARLITKVRENGLVMYQIEFPLQEGGSAQCWIDARQWRVRRIVYQDAHLGSGQVTVRDLDCSAEAVPALTLDIPDGVPIKEVTVENNRPLSLEEAQLAFSFPLRTPSYLPEGMAFSVAYQLDKNLALVYAGKHSFTLMQGPEILVVPQENATTVVLRGQQAMVVQNQAQGGLVLVWQEDGLQFSIAGSIDQDEAVRIAESMDVTFKGAHIGEAAGASDDQGR